jgi:hypothetical protein
VIPQAFRLSVDLLHLSLKWAGPVGRRRRGLLLKGRSFFVQAIRCVQVLVGLNQDADPSRLVVAARHDRRTPRAFMEQPGLPPGEAPCPVRLIR